MKHYDIFSDCHAGRGGFYLQVDIASGLRAIIAVSNPERGPALGGCRITRHLSSVEGLIEASQLANTMQYKSAIHGLPLSGGKAVLLAPSVIVDRKAYFRAFGAFVESLEGKYITAMDSGVGKADMNAIADKTTYVTNFCKVGGAPSAYTAKGVSLGIQAVVSHHLNKTSLKGVSVLIQGIGKVGYELMRRMVALGADVIISDIHDGIVKQCKREFGVRSVLPCDIYQTTCDVFAPCATGSVLNLKTLSLFKAKIIAGAANNPLAHESQAELLHARRIIYVPDYVINAGGLIFSARQYLGSGVVSLDDKIEHIYDLTLEILKQSDAHRLSPLVVANRYAQRMMMKERPTAAISGT